MRKILLVALGSTAFLLSACNTVQGLGEDIVSVGECADGVEGNC